MTSSTNKDTPSWRGVQFFISTDVLLTFDSVKMSDLDGRPGQPQRRIALIDGKALPVTSFPAASFFLKVLKSTGNSIVAVSPWKPEKTSSILRLFGWNLFDDIRTIYKEPGQEDIFGLSSVSCALQEYSTAVVITLNRALWHTSLWPQIIEVKHELSRPSFSLALLRTLSCCLRICECRIRFPHTAVSPCVAICRSRLFSRYRFCIAPEVLEESSVAMLINEHGGFLVNNCEDATHYVVGEEGSSLSCTLQKPILLSDESNMSPSTASSSSSSSSSFTSMNENENVDVEIISDGSESNNNEEEEEEEDDEEENEDDNEETGKVSVNNNNNNNSNKAGNTKLPSSETKDPNLDSQLPSTNGKHDVNINNDSSLKVSHINTVNTVTITWIRDCIEGLLVYPPQVAHSSDDSSNWNISALLLAALLPPPDAEPISLSHFNNIAETYGFRPIKPSQITGEVDLASVLKKQWGAALNVETKGEDLLLSQPPISLNENGTELETHLNFVAELFCGAWTHVLRERKLRNSIDSGTQTAVIITANFATNTEVSTSSPTTNIGGDSSQSQGRMLLMRALGPAEWAKQVDASHNIYPTLKTAEQSLPLEAANGITLLNEPPLSGLDSPPVEGQDIQINKDDKNVGILGDRSRETVKEQTVLQSSTSSAPTPTTTTEVTNEKENEEREYMRCFIPTGELGDEKETLDKDALLLLAPFRNYPMKLTVDDRGIHCQFVTSLDAMRFRKEGYAEVRNRFLPILPEHEEDEGSSFSGVRKRHRSRSPVISRSNNNNSNISRKTRKESTSSSSYNSHSHRTSSDSRKTPDGSNSFELSKSDLDLLSEIGATYEFALQQVEVVERYALNELADPVYRRQQHQLLRVVAKLKNIKSKAA